MRQASSTYSQRTHSETDVVTQRGRVQSGRSANGLAVITMSSAMTKTAGFTRMMRHTATAVVLAVIAAATLLQRPAAQAQGGALLGRVGRGSPEDAFVSSDKDTRSYNKRDFNGLWARNPQAYGLPPCAECGDPGPWPGYGYHGTPPPRTPEGEKRFQANKPSRGIELGSP